MEENGVLYCVIGGVGVNAYAEPIVTQTSTSSLPQRTWSARGACSKPGSG